MTQSVKSLDFDQKAKKDQDPSLRLAAFSKSLRNSSFPSDEWRMGLTVDTIRNGVFNADFLRSDRIAILIEKQLIDTSIAKHCAASLLKQINLKLYCCFPGDAFDGILAMQVLAPQLSPTRPLQNRYSKFIERLGFDGLIDATIKSKNSDFSPVGISALAAREHFRYLGAYNAREYAALAKSGVTLIHDLIVSAFSFSSESRKNLLTKAISTFRLLGYLHKRQEQTHFYCSDEYDEFCKIEIREGEIRRTEISSEPLEAGQYNLQYHANSEIGFKTSRFGPRERLLSQS